MDRWIKELATITTVGSGKDQEILYRNTLGDVLVITLNEIRIQQCGRSTTLSYSEIIDVDINPLFKLKKDYGVRIKTENRNFNFIVDTNFDSDSDLTIVYDYIRRNVVLSRKRS